jgi:FKBP-type peptidyl-prolyl cis-trans isomerase
VGPDETIINMRNSVVLLALLLTAGIVFSARSAAAQDSSAGKTANASAAKTPPPQASPATTPAANSALKDEKDKVSYALGMNLGSHLRADDIAVDTNLILQGLKDTLAGSKTLMTEDEAGSSLRALQSELMAKQQARKAKEGDSNKSDGEAFLAANKTKPGVVTLPSGLQYKILTTGTGPKPSASDSVVCNYRGTLINGKEFDSSYKRGEPATFPVGGVIKGWTEALQLMPVGSKWQLFVPSDLAYGAQGAGGDIGPNATLIFEVELISIKAPEKP